MVSSGCSTPSTPVPPTVEPAISESPTNIPEPTATVTQTPQPTPLPGSVVLPVDTLGEGIPWLPLDETKRPGVNYIGFNTQKPPFNSALVRLAFAHAIDREAIVEMAIRYRVSNPTPATTFTPPQTLGRDLYNVVGANFDPQKAKDSLTQAGYSDPSSFPTVFFSVNISGETAPGARFNMASAMAKMWQTHLGVHVEIQPINTFSEYNNQLRDNTPDLYWIGWVADYNDPANFIGEIFNPNGDNHGAMNYGEFSNPEFNELIDSAAEAQDPAIRQELYIQAERLLCETEAGVIPIFHTR